MGCSAHPNDDDSLTIWHEGTGKNRVVVTVSRCKRCGAETGRDISPDPE